MTNHELARILIEELTEANINRKIAVYLNRLMLRLHSQPALLANLDNVTAIEPGGSTNTNDQVEDGKFNEDQNEDPKKNEEKDDSNDDSPQIIQLSFKRLPREVLTPLIRLIAAPREPKLYRYTKDGFARLGVEITVKPSDFPGDDYDYSF